MRFSFIPHPLYWGGGGGGGGGSEALRVKGPSTSVDNYLDCRLEIIIALTVAVLAIPYGFNGPSKLLYSYQLSSTLFVMDSTFILPDRLHTF